MASRWFVFWIVCFAVCVIKNENASAVLFLFLAAITNDPLSELKNSIYQEQKRIIQQYFEHYFGKKPNP